jgi:hypothetical protein
VIYTTFTTSKSSQIEPKGKHLLTKDKDALIIFPEKVERGGLRFATGVAYQK